MHWKEVSLYGGSATCMMPATWVDASSLRDVPDHQEVYVHPEAQFEQSVIIEILQYESSFPDTDAGMHFFNDLANADGSTSIEIDATRNASEKVKFLELDVTQIHVQGVQTKAKTGPASEMGPVFVLMDVIRVPRFDSDILVTCHSLPEGRANIEVIHEGIVRSLRFRDSSLFV
jgi:hypothetical protein